MEVAVRDQALRLASTVWNSPSHEIADDTMSADILHELADAGIVDQDEERWQFTCTEMLFFLKAVELIDSQSLHEKEPSEILQVVREFIESAFTDPVNKSSTYRPVLGFTLIELINEYAREDILEFVAADGIDKQLFWDFYVPFCNSVPVLTLNIPVFAATLETIEKQARDDQARSRTYNAVEQLGASRPEFAYQLLDHFSESPNEVNAGFIERLLTGIAQSSPENFQVVMDRCTIWIESDDGLLCQAAVSCAQNLILNETLDPDWLLSRFKILLSKSDDVRYTLAVVVARLGYNLEEYSDECLDMLSQLKARGPADRITHGIAYVLHRSRDKRGSKYKIACLSLLEDVSIEEKGTINQTEWSLYPLAQVRPQEVWRYLRKWILAHGIEESIAEHDMFHTVLQEAYESDPEGGTTILTNWCVAQDLRLVNEALSILNELGVHTFDPTTLNSLSPDRIVFIIEKLFSTRWQPDQLLSLFFSILQYAEQKEQLSGYFSKALWYLAWNYPASTEEFLRKKFEAEQSPILSDLLKKTLERLAEYQSQREDIYVQELAPSKRRVIKYHEFFHKTMQHAQEVAFNDDRYIFMNLTSQVAIGRGNRTFNMNKYHPDPARKRAFTQPQAFDQFSHEVEVPRWAIIDPEGETGRRLLRLSRTLNEVKEDE